MPNNENPLVPSDAVRAIQDSIVTATIAVDEGEFTTRPVYLPPKEYIPAPLAINTLSGIVEYVKNGVDKQNEAIVDGWMIHVADPETVTVISGIFGRAEQRREYLRATAAAVLSDADFLYGEFYDCETFNIKLQSVFVENDDRDKVLRLVGNIKEESVRQTGDDGVTQTVTARSGIARVEDVPVPNPVNLMPYRTFREVTQPASDFILRMKTGREGQMPTCALFEADGGAWKLRAIQLISTYLKESVGEITIIA
jgi:hypothetical protein